MLAATHFFYYLPDGIACQLKRLTSKYNTLYRPHQLFRPNLKFSAPRFLKENMQLFIYMFMILKCVLYIPFRSSQNRNKKKKKLLFYR